MSQTNSDWSEVWLEQTEELEKGGSDHPQMPHSDFIESGELRRMGISCLEGCLVHRTVLMYGRDRIKLGRNVRIDAYTVLSAGNGHIFIGDFTHVSSHVLIFGGSGVRIEKLSALGAGTKIFSQSDEFRGNGLIGPMVPEHTRIVRKGIVLIEALTALGVNCTVMPGAVLSYGSYMLAGSLLVGQSEPMAILHGAPAKKVRDRERGFEKHLGKFGPLQPESVPVP